MANWVIRCSERYLSLVYDRLQKHLCAQKIIQADETTCQVTKDGRLSDAKELAHETVAHKALVQIAAIYKAEEALKDLTEEERYDCRQRERKPLVEAYFAWVHEQDPTTILSQKTRDGLTYSINQEKYLRVFLEYGNIPIDNSATERSIRPFTLGRANWHIIDTIHGAEASATIYSLVETAKANKLKIYEYLKHLLTEIPKHMEDASMEFLEDLLPWSEKLPEVCHKKI